MQGAAKCRCWMKHSSDSLSAPRLLFLVFTYSSSRRGVIRMQGAAKCRCWMKHSSDSLSAPRLLFLVFTFVDIRRRATAPVFFVYLTKRVSSQLGETKILLESPSSNLRELEIPN